MIYEMAQDIAERLRAKSYPVQVEYGPEQHGRECVASALIVFERDRDGPDAFRPSQGARVNPKLRGVRGLSAKATIYARSSVDGAHVGNHERLCEQLIDALTCTIYDWGVEAQTGGIPITGGRYVPARERNDVQAWAGVVYELTFSVPRGVTERAFVAEQAAGSARPEVVAPGFTNRTDVTLAHAPDGTLPATGCGGDPAP